MAIDTLGANALASNSVTTAKIAADAVTSAKIPAGAVVASDVADGSVTTAKLADNAVTSAKALNLGRRNLVINGAMQVAQRGTSSTGTGYQTVDRMSVGFAGHDEAPTMTQADVASGTSPYTTGFRKSLKIQNGNQTSGAGAADELALTYHFEGQDIAESGWNVASASSNVTLSFWVKSSVAQQFQTNVRLYGPANGNQREFAFAYTLSANTWTKVTKTIPGHASNTVRGDNALGMFLQFPMFWGTNYTNNARNHDTWEAKNNAQNMKDYVSTWWTTNDATWEITGIQLEAGDAATDFEHRSVAEELSLCQRYFCQVVNNTGSNLYLGLLQAYNTSSVYGFIKAYPATMRADPSVSQSGSFGGYTASSGSWNGGSAWGNFAGTSVGWYTGGTGGGSNLTAGHAVVVFHTGNGKLMADAEL